MKINEIILKENADKASAVRRVQKMLNTKFDANLDIDGILGPLTLKTINQFMPGALPGTADSPDRNTRVQGFDLKEDDKNKCPPATQDITLNLKNRQKAIDEYGYGPLNPDLPNNKFWQAKVDEWNLDSVEEAKSSLCGNCAAFDQRKDTLDCIAQGIGSDAGAEDPTIEAGDLGYCRFLKFKCASRRTCDAWVTGGPLTDQTNENFADGKGPGRAGDSQRHGIPKGATIAQLEKAAKASGRKGQLARWQLNMRRGKKDK
jgi:hypothetical protein